MNPVLITQTQRLQSLVCKIKHCTSGLVLVGDVPEVKSWIHVVVTETAFSLRFVRCKCELLA